MLPRISAFNSNLSFSSVNAPLQKAFASSRQFAFAGGNANNPYAIPTNNTGSTSRGYSPYGEGDDDKKGWSSLPTWMKGAIIGGIAALAALGGEVGYDRFIKETGNSGRAVG